MNHLDALETLLRGGVALLAAAAGKTPRQLASLGLPLHQARSMLTLAGVYFGPTKSTARQRRCAAAARANGHSLPTLEMIEKHAGRVPSPWALREELCAMTGSYEEIRAHAKARVEELTADRPPNPRRGLRVTHDVQAMAATIHYTAPEHEVAALLAEVRTPEGFRALLADGAPTTVIRTHAFLHVDEEMAIESGEGDDILFALSNGARMTGAELLAAKYRERGEDVLVHPMHGAVNAYRTSRFANEKQRLLAAAENPVCGWDGCGSPADKSQVHHLRAWEHGGPTNAENHATCCGYHNGVNDDDPNAPPRRGRLERRNGEIVYVSPGGSVTRNGHPTARLGVMRRKAGTPA
ncbi:HNH endonuclease signature motif containing protein [Corynebacterium guangdongense]|uniref:HNH nuclease domain-containing protein n=1 Tax=Corynebacterium guangdongense TaxID=1783348 RepID=A0ABU1ZVD4_9CORY|nr:HNH endonuclease signature motif containing protein [Corynebacterium guangdongense]MDR7328876.1 hypothetical protein [Corynebacterium guangdongense]WJZ17451.1 hypothetical protein CGUA_04305 [Corynebacterium guangdongense]